MDNLLTPDELSAQFKIPKSWIYGRIHSKNLPFPMVKIGHYVRFPEDGVRAFIQSAMNMAAKDKGNEERR